MVCLQKPQNENEKTAESYFKMRGWTSSKNAQHEHVILHFRNETKVETDYQVSVDGLDLDLPSLPTITHQALTMNNEEINAETPSTQTQNNSKLLFVYDALSDAGKTIKIIGDNGATIHLANENDLDKLGQHRTVGTTRISTVANKELEETETVQVSLESEFKNK